MTRAQTLIFLAWLSVLAGGCGVTGNSSKFSFIDGYYRSRLNDNKYKEYYVKTGSDSIKVYPAHIGQRIGDTVKSITVLFPEHIAPADFSKKKFSSQNFDLDL